MKIIVPIKVSGSPDESAKITDNEVERSSLEWDVNEWDRFSIEAALTLREAEDGEVIVLSVGGEEIEDGLLTALAMGADRAIQVNVDVDDKGPSLDAISMAKVIAKAIESEAPDLILCGTQSSDGASGATGTALAALLDLPRVAVAASLEYADGVITVARELEGGVHEKVTLSTPALVTVQTGMNEPRYANLRGIRQAGSKPRNETTIQDLGLDADELATGSAHVTALALPQETTGAQILDGDAASVASQIAQIIKSKVGS